MLFYLILFNDSVVVNDMSNVNDISIKNQILSQRGHIVSKFQKEYQSFLRSLSFLIQNCICFINLVYFRSYYFSASILQRSWSISETLGWKGPSTGKYNSSMCSPLNLASFAFHLGLSLQIWEWPGVTGLLSRWNQRNYFSSSNMKAYFYI